MKVRLGWGGLRSLGIYGPNTATFRGTERTVNQPSRNVITVIRLLCVYLENSTLISAELSVKKRKRQ